MNKELIDRIVDTEINFCSLFADTIVKDYGKLFYNDKNKQSWDSNHAIITKPNKNIDSMIDDIAYEYKKRIIVPRIYSSFNLDNDVITALCKRKWKFENTNNWTFYLHNKNFKIIKPNQTFKIDKYTEAIDEVVLSDPDEGSWATNTIKIGFERNYIEIIGLNQGDKLIGFYVYHSNDGITRIDNVFIHYKYRNKGLGHLLIGNMIQNHYDNCADVLYLYSSNPIAKRIYEKYGFEKMNMPGNLWIAYLPL